MNVFRARHREKGILKDDDTDTCEETKEVWIGKIYIKKIDASDVSIQITFASDSKIDPLKLIKLLSEDKRCRMNGPDKIKISVTLSDILERVKFIKDFLGKIFLS